MAQGDLPPVEFDKLWHCSYGVGFTAMHTAMLVLQGSYSSDFKESSGRLGKELQRQSTVEVKSKEG